ncbi:MAG TPA: methylmalonyl-CoA decarboxylase [Pirellulales bacterium]|nr:methylmalonyl-CoA decarboxylase [Pirellulales bacterium]
MSLVLQSITDSIGTLTLNQPEKRNALSRALIDELIAGLDASAAAEVRAVVLRAAPGSRVWSAGHDVRELPAAGRDPLTYNDPLRRAVRAIESFPAPVLALIEGGVWGGACELALSCDLLVATPEATFAITPARMGVPYDMCGMLSFMKMINMPVLKEMLFTGRPIPAERALAAGALNYVVPAAELERFVYELAARITETSPLCVAAIKEELRMLSESMPLDSDTFERLQELRRKVYDSHDYEEGIRAFLEKRPPVFKGR